MKENEKDNVATFLDLNIKIKKGRFSTKLYDKRNVFNFSIMRLRNKHSSIHSKMFYSTIFTEISRIFRAAFSYNDFYSSNHTLISCIKKQGAEINIVIKALSKIIFRYTEDVLKFNIRQEDIIKIITS